MLAEADIEAIVARLVRRCAPLAAGTVGSYAVGLAKDSSDLDLFVIQRTPLPRAARRRAVMQALFGVLHPLDVHVFTPEEFEAGAQREVSFEWIIVRQARIYHWSDEGTRSLPSLAARLAAAAATAHNGKATQPPHTQKS